MDGQEDDLWEYNAPQYVDFNARDDDDNADEWFDLDHENERHKLEKDGLLLSSQGTDDLGEQVIQSVPQSDSMYTPQETPSTPQESRRLTRSMCSTPQNDKGLPEATDCAMPSAQNSGKIKHSDGPVIDLKKKLKGCQIGNKSQDLQNHREEISDSSSQESERGRSRSLKRTNSMRGVNQGSQLPKRRSADNAGANVRPHSDTRSSSQTSIGRPNSQSSIGRPNSERRSQTGGDSGSLKRSESVRSSNSQTRIVRTKSVRRSQVNDQGIPNRINTNTQRARTGSTSSVSSNNMSQDSDTSGTTHKMPKLTIPTTPTFMRRKPISKLTGDKVKSTEEQKMEEIANIRAEFMKRKKQTQKSYQTAMKSTGYVPVQSKVEPTKPEDFHFKTDERIKSTHSSSEEKSTDFVRMLRSNSKGRSPTQTQKGPTKPQPFNLSDGRKRKEADSQSDGSFKSMAEQLTAFHKQTPDRFRSQSKNPVGKTSRVRSKSPAPGLTIPKTPNFETRGRSRPVNAPSQKDIEDKEVEEMKKQQFKANPVNKKILTNPNTGVKKVPSKPVTEFDEFDLELGKRPHDRSKKQDEEKYEFHAQPVPKKILEGTVGVKPVKGLPLTVPESPAFSLRQRVRLPLPQEDQDEIEKSVSKKNIAHHGVPFQPVLSHKSTVPQPFGFENRNKARLTQKTAAIEKYLEEEKKVTKEIKVHPIPHVGIPFQPTLNHKSTKPEPFTFEQRDKRMFTRKQEKIEEVYAEERKAREFHAQPLPLGESHLPAKQTKPVTIPEPFHLEVDSRGTKRVQELTHKVEEETRQLRSQASFKAQPAKVIHKEPFCPQKSHKPLTDISGFELNTEQRSHQRENYLMHKKAREAELEAMKRMREVQQEEEEKAAVAKLRTEMVHKSQPIKRFKSMEVLPSDKPLTAAESPKFETDRRLRNKVRAF